MKTTIFFVVLVCIFFDFQTSQAQIGVDNPTPNQNASLDLKAFDKGLLLPRLSTAQRFALLTNCTGAGNCPEGLLVYDSEKSAFFYLVSNQWFMLNPWNAPDAIIASTEDVQNHAIIGNVGISITPGAGNQLDVNGSVLMRSNFSVGGGTTVVTGNVQIDNGAMSVGNNLTTGSTIASGQKITANGFSSDITAVNVSGPVPKGGIIIFSGSTVPSGWALCDGSSGTPDLSGKFIVSYGSRTERILTAAGGTILGATNTYNIGDEGGHDFVKLSNSH